MPGKPKSFISAPSAAIRLFVWLAFALPMLLVSTLAGRERVGRS